MNARLVPVAERAETNFPEILKTPGGNILVHVLGALRTAHDSVVKTQLDLQGSDAGTLNETVKTLLGTLDLTQITELGSPVYLDLGFSQTMKGKVVKLKEPIALIRTEALTSSRVEVDIVEYEILFDSQPDPQNKRQKLAPADELP